MSEAAMFWLVWNPARGMPTLRHESKTSARTEAERLALQHAGETFIVLESVGHYQTTKPVQFTKHVNGNKVAATYTFTADDSGEWERTEASER